MHAARALPRSLHSCTVLPDVRQVPQGGRVGGGLHCRCLGCIAAVQAGPSNRSLLMGQHSLPRATQQQMYLLSVYVWAHVAACQLPKPCRSSADAVRSCKDVAHAAALLCRSASKHLTQACGMADKPVGHKKGASTIASKSFHGDCGGTGRMHLKF